MAIRTSTGNRFFMGDTPMLVVKDVHMINEIFIKDSSKFHGRGVMPSMLHALQQFIDILGEHADRGVEVDINSLCERFTFDAISKAAYGIDTNVQRNPEVPMFQNALAVVPKLNAGFFYNLGQNLYHWRSLLKVPAKLLGTLYSNPLAEMTKKTTDVIQYRRMNPQVGLPDMAQILLDGLVNAENSAAQKNKANVDITAPLPTETLNQLSSNCMTVFIGGYDTTRLALTFWFYVMGKHPDVQEKMRVEVLGAFERRFTSRCADEDCRYGKYLIRKGTSVMVPTYQLHHDPKYWDEPEKFKPERFSPENKSRINPTAYQPFGLGPRICIGQRLALLELASATTQVLRHYRIELGASQKHDVELDTYSYLLVPKDGVQIRLHRLNNEK
ncbi:hypothetical protein HPB49_012649 [Dermacentor silvarum]|uniref:Uncharacterized protein n=1 Tax=Dermacentor silvarum TaxID=543639 RepID=A0ACB8CR32_DERSI|nr:hypothetical protein HPB49_012649 [Dermacentor silvarum]